MEMDKGNMKISHYFMRAAEMKCRMCGEDTFLPFRCPYCGDFFCPDHRLPETHQCPRMELARAPSVEVESTILGKERVNGYSKGFPSMPRQRAKMVAFSQKELRHLAVGTVLVVGVGVSFIPQVTGLSFLTVPETIVSLVTVLVFSFLLHEIAHKLLAQKYGLWAEFRLTFFGALLTLLSMLPFPFFKIMSPGAIMIVGAVGKREAGKTALAGPCTNVALSLLFILPVLVADAAYQVFLFGGWINAIMATFNLLPFGVMDGLKVYRWDKLVWAVVFAVSVILVIISYGFFFSIQ